jgi:hypothetical protein
LPADITTGEYELWLNMPDKYASVSSRSEYGIRLGNVYVWKDATGYNNLNHVLVIE